MLLKQIKFNSLYAILILLINLGYNANAASFDCSNAKYEDEKAICADSVLNNTDYELGKLYRRVSNLLKPEQAAELSKDQFNWIQKRRTECKEDTACLNGMYQDRMEYLTKYDSIISQSIQLERSQIDSTNSKENEVNTNGNQTVGIESNQNPIVSTDNNPKQPKQLSQKTIYTFVFLVLFALLIFIVGGIGLRSVGISKYNYKVFSLINMGLGILATSGIGVATYLLLCDPSMQSVAIGIFIFSIIMIGILYYTISTNTSWLFGLFSLVYLIIINIFIIMVILIFLFGSKSDRTFKKRNSN